MMYKTCGSLGNSRFSTHIAWMAVSGSFKLMAHRAVAISARYFNCLSATLEVDFFSGGNASLQCPCAANSMARSTEVEATTVEAFGDDCAKTKPGITKENNKTCPNVC